MTAGPLDPMDYERFVTMVEQEIGDHTPAAEAAAAARATCRPR